MCKISAKTKSVKGEITWRMFPDPVICTNSEALLGVIQGTDKVEIMREPTEPTGSSATPEITAATSPEIITEADLLAAGQYSDVKENLRSLNQISQSSPETPFTLLKSTVGIYRFEDVIFSIYPHLAAHRRRGTSAKEVFQQVDPMAKKKAAEDTQTSGLGANAGGTAENINR